MPEHRHFISAEGSAARRRKAKADSAVDGPLVVAVICFVGFLLLLWAYAAVSS